MPRTTFYERKNVRVTIQPNTGLDASCRQSVVEMLNLLLADEAVLTLKMQLADEHEGERLGNPELHSLYDAHNKQIYAISNEIVERVQILGGSHLGNTEELIGAARLGRESNIISGIVSILADQEAFIRFLREDARKCSEMYEDQGTFALLISVLRTHEKMAWILRSNITSGLLVDEK